MPPLTESSLSPTLLVIVQIVFEHEMEKVMRTPVMDSVVERRLLVNYRITPEVVARLLPAGFRPQVVRGWAVGGVCAIRLGSLRPHGMPAYRLVSTPR